MRVLHNKIRLLTILSLVLTMVILSSSASAASITPDIDAKGTQGNKLLPYPSKKYIPDALQKYTPELSGLITKLAGLGNAASAPTAQGVEGILIQLICLDEAISSSGQMLWRLCIALCIIGFFISGYLTFARVARGQESIGSGVLQFLGKLSLVVIVVSLIVGNLPFFLVNVCNQITSSMTSVGDVADKTPLDAAMLQKYKAAMGGISGYQNHAASLISTAAANDPQLGLGNMTYDSVRQTLKSIKLPDWNTMEGQLKDAINGNSGWSTTIFGYGGSPPGSDSGSLGLSIGQANNMVGQIVYKEYDKALGQTADKVADIVKNPMKYQDANNVGGGSGGSGAPPSGSPGGQSTQEATAMLLDRALNYQPMEATSLSKPFGILAQIAYIAFVYIAIGIWSLPIALLVWATLYAFPSQWFQGVLFGGIKYPLTIILSVLLTIIYVQAGVGIAMQADPMQSQQALNFATLAQFVQSAKGISVELFVVLMLILTAPAQAAGIIAGSNAIAEHAKNAMEFGGGSSGQKQYFGGSYGQFSPQMSGEGSFMPSRSSMQESRQSVAPKT